jgi:hypothetical protein
MRRQRDHGGQPRESVLGPVYRMMARSLGGRYESGRREDDTRREERGNEPHLLPFQAVESSRMARRGVIDVMNVAS